MHPERIGWGHSTITQAIGFATAAGAKRLVTFHHDPGHDDATLDRLVEDARRSLALPFQLIPGVEGASFDLDKL
jgi:ribonuclease BN (tRNA processing enzyme)